MSIIKPTFLDRIKRKIPETTKVRLFDDYEYETSVDISNNYLAWLDKIEYETRYAGAIGGRLTFMIVPTSIGTLAKVYDELTKEEFDLTCHELF